MAASHFGPPKVSLLGNGQLFCFSHQLGRFDAECIRQLEDGGDGRLVLACLNQGDEIALYAGLQAQLFLGQTGCKSVLAQDLTKGDIRCSESVSRHMGKLSFSL